MSKIKDDKSAKVGLSGLFGTRNNPETAPVPKTNPETAREEILQSLSPETREELQREVPVSYTHLTLPTILLV